MRVATVTFNPAIDQTVMLERLVPGEVHRASSVRQDAGGKGINVASCLADWGIKVSAHGLLGAGNAEPFATLFAAKGIADQMVRHSGATRINLKLVDVQGTTDINMDGPATGEDQVEAVKASLAPLPAAGALVVLGGSLPPGCPADVYRTITKSVKEGGGAVLLDTSGAPLRAALSAPVLPDILKPNRHELSEWLGTPVRTHAEVARAAADLCRRGVRLVAVSLGEEGALFMSGERSLTARLSAGSIASTVGAGDAMVAGIAAAWSQGEGLERIARLSTAFAVGKLGLPGPHLPEREAVEALAASVLVETAPHYDIDLAGEGK